MERMVFGPASRRRVDENGFLHVSNCHITKQGVNEYLGAEIPGWQELGLDGQRIYRGFRPGAELAKAAATFNGLPLLSQHLPDSAALPQKEFRVGNLGTQCVYNAPYLDNALIIQDADAIAALEPQDAAQPAKRELSASYRYVPVFEPGEFEGEPYDFRMTKIRGNHVALVEEGRAGPDVLVADAKTVPDQGQDPQGKTMQHNLAALLKRALDLLSGSAAPIAADEEFGFEPEVQVELEPSKTEDKTPEILGKLLDSLVDLAAAQADPALSEALAVIIREALAEQDEQPETVEVEPVQANDQRSWAYSKQDHKLARKIRSDLAAQVEAARLVRPLAGDLDPLAFDSAAQIYRKALAMAGRPSQLNNVQALKELALLACDAKSGAQRLPLPAKSGAKQQFPHLAGIRQA